MTTGDVVYSLRFSLIKILPEPGFDLGSTAGESCVLTARLHMLYIQMLYIQIQSKIRFIHTNTTTRSHPCSEKTTVTSRVYLVIINLAKILSGICLFDYHSHHLYVYFLFIQHLLSALFTNQYALMRCLKHNK